MDYLIVLGKISWVVFLSELSYHPPPQATLQLPNHVRELIELVKPKKVCVQHVYNTSD